MQLNLAGMMSPMRFRHELAYDAPPADVIAMISDPLFWDRVGEANQALSCTTTVATEGGTTRVVIDQEQKVAGVPSFAKKFVGESTRAIITQVWQGHEASYEIETPGKPTHVTGTVTVTENGSGSVLVYDLDVKASVPLIGGKLEKLVVDLTNEGFDTEQSVGAAWLAGEHA
jgi:carbon monoxide dehydrogenase subunit G